MKELTNIVIVGRRPGQTQDFYYNTFEAENAAVHGSSGDEKWKLFERLKIRAIESQSFWLGYEPEGTVIRIEHQHVKKLQARLKGKK